MLKHFFGHINAKIISKEMYPGLKIRIKNVSDFAVNKIIQIMGQT